MAEEFLFGFGTWGSSGVLWKASSWSSLLKTLPECVLLSWLVDWELELCSASMVCLSLSGIN